MSSYFWIFVGTFTYFIHSTLIFKFSIPLLKYATKKNIVFLIIPIINTGIFVSAYFLGLSYFALYTLSFGLYIFYFLCSSKAPFRQVLFGASSYLINLASIHFLVLLCVGAVLNVSISTIFSNTVLFFIVLSVSYALLIGVLFIAKKFLSAKRLLAISTARGYSEIMGVSTSLLFGVILTDSWVLYNNTFILPFFVSSIATIAFVVIMYYCLFFVNTYIIVLHPYKRKADEAVSLHGQVIERKKVTEYKLYTDDLTSLYNKRFIYQKLDELCEDEKSHFGVIYADLAALKTVNDAFGHKVGDRYILSVSNAFRKAVREDDFCARIGGDEFVVILSDVTTESLTDIISRIKELVSEQNQKEKFTVYANLGFMTFDLSLQKRTRTEVLEAVDKLMKKEKQLFYEQGGV